MPHHRIGTKALFVYICLLAFTGHSRADDPRSDAQTKVQIELWMAEVDLGKLRALNLTYDHRGDDGQLRQVRIADVLEGKEKDAPILQSPDKLLRLLREAGVARVLAEPTLVTTAGRKAQFEVRSKKQIASSPFLGTRVEATPTVHPDGQIQLDLRAEHTEPLPRVRWFADPGQRQALVQTAVVMEPGKVGLVPPLAQMTYPNGPPNAVPGLPMVFVRATLDPATEVHPVAPASSSAPAVTATSATSSVKSLKVHLKVLEVDRDKLKKLGFQWSKVAPDGQSDFSVQSLDSLFANQKASGDELNRFLQALQQNGLARVLAEPTLLTLDGRPAAFSVGQTTVDFVPILLVGERVKLECQLNAGSSPVQIRDAELELGKFALVRPATTASARSARSRTKSSTPPPGKEIFVLARVDVLKAGEIPTIGGAPTYIEVAGKPK
jgi:hypothetical protein